MKHQVASEKEPSIGRSHQAPRLSQQRGKIVKIYGYAPRLVLVLTTLACLVAPRRSLADPNSTQTIQVSGSIEENFVEENITSQGLMSATGFDVWMGSLEGTGVVHLFRTPDPTQDTATRKLFTSQGNLFFTEPGEVDFPFVHSVATIIGGTGIYKGAAGQLILEGVIEGPGLVTFTYTGTLTLAN
jgi:hypothetical protein